MSVPLALLAGLSIGTIVFLAIAVHLRPLRRVAQQAHARAGGVLRRAASHRLATRRRAEARLTSSTAARLGRARLTLRLRAAVQVRLLSLDLRVRRLR